MPYQRASLVVLVIILTAASAGAADYVPSTDLRDVGLAPFWQLRLPLEPGQTVLDVYLVDDQLYACTQDGYVFAVHAPTGSLRWMRQVTRLGHRLKRPCHIGSDVVFATPRQVTAYDRLRGDGTWRHDLRFVAVTPPITDGTSYFLAGNDARCYTFDVETRRQTNKFMTDAPAVGAMALHSLTLFLVTGEGEVVAADPVKRVKTWHEFPKTLAPVTAGVIADKTGVYVASTDQSLWRYSLQDGALFWRARFSGPLHESPVLTEDTAFQYCADDGMVAVDLRTEVEDERLRWKLPRGRHFLTLDDKRAFVLTDDGRIAVVGLEGGDAQRDIPAAGFTMAQPMLDAPGFYLADRHGRLFCARAKDVPFPRGEAVVKSLLKPKQAEEEPEDAAKAAAAASDDVIPLQSSLKGKPVGGKSKISKEWTPPEEKEEE